MLTSLNKTLIGAIPDLMFVLSCDGTIINYKADDKSLLDTNRDIFLEKISKIAFRQILLSMQWIR